MNDLFELPLAKLQQQLVTKAVSAVELTKLYLDQTKRNNQTTNAYITITEKEALAQAEAADKDIAAGNNQSLTGLPYSLKDAYNTAGILTTSASNVLKTYQAPYSSTVYQKLLEQNAVLIGKTNQDAWGHGSTSENTDFGPVVNPYNSDRVAGGSSGGAAAALASRTSSFAIGEDTGGSIRNPSSFCNITGLKVTYGRVSRYGAIAYASSLDTVGPMAKTAADCALVLESIAGADPKDASSSQEPVPSYTQMLNRDIKGKKIGVINEFMGNGLDPEVKQVIETALKQLTGLGAEIVEVSVPTAKYGVAIYYILAMCETSSNLGRYDGIRYGQGREFFTGETKRRIMTGTYALSSGYYDAYYKKAVAARMILTKEFEQAFSEIDMLISPVMPTVAPKLKHLETVSTEDVLQGYLADLYTCVINPVGLPGLAFPAGFSGNNLPVGAQLIGPKFSEGELLNTVHQYQQVTDWHKRKPII
jgi:aspartyl-tRNA(Asn)/glutamyl-tRNA(Gln) amidotransferase subunit A